MHDRNSAVRELQRYIRTIALERGDVPTIVVDGFYDDVTSSAVSALQRSLGLPVTGTTDLATWNAARDESAAVSDRRAWALSMGGFSPPTLVLGEGSSGDTVLMLQIMLAAISARFSTIRLSWLGLPVWLTLIQ